MNVNTGELLRLMNKSDIPNEFTEVPDQFSDEAEALLRNMDRVKVDMKTPSPLVNWAKKRKREASEYLFKIQ